METVKGNAELQRKLNQLKGSKRRTIMRRSVTKGIRPVVKASKAVAPRAKRQRGTKRKRLASTLTHKVGTVKGTDVVYGVVGQDTKKARHSRLSKEENQKRAVNLNLTISRISSHDIRPRPGTQAIAYRAPVFGRGRRANIVFTRRVRHPGITNRNWLESAAKSSLPTADRIILNEADHLIEKELS